MKRLNVIHHVCPLSVLPALVVSGCMGPIAAPTSNKGRSSSATSTATARPGAPAPPGVGLVVQNETLPPDDIWRADKAALAEKLSALPPEEFRAFVQNRAVQLITDRVAESLLYQQASLRLEGRLTEAIDRNVDSEIRRVVTAQHDGIQRRYEKDLESKGRSLHELRENTRRQFVVQAYLESEFKPKVAEPKRAELLAAYQESVAALRKPARRSMSLIDVRISEFLPSGVDEPTREQWQAARSEARKQIRTAQVMLLEGAYFPGVAARYSHGLQAADGGKWGCVTSEGVRERFAPAVAALEKLGAGQVSEIVETPDAFFLVRCDELEPGYDPDFESVQPELADRFFRIEYNRLVAVHVEELRKKSGVSQSDLERFHAAVVDAAYRIVRETSDPRP